MLPKDPPALIEFRLEFGPILGTCVCGNPPPVTPALGALLRFGGRIPPLEFGFRGSDIIDASDPLLEFGSAFTPDSRIVAGETTYLRFGALKVTFSTFESPVTVDPFEVRGLE